MESKKSIWAEKWKSPASITAGVLLGIMVCLGIFYLWDTVLNGALLDWFTSNYMIEAGYTATASGEPVYAFTPMWGKIKELLFMVACISLVFGGTVIALWGRHKAKKEREKVIAQTGNMIRIYMEHDVDISDVFPDGYGPVEARMTQIKAQSRQQEQAMKEEAARKNDLITYLAHDLKTPLTSVIGYLSLLDEAKDLPEGQRQKYIGITLDKAERLEKLINEFFDITRYNFNQIVLEKERIDLSYMLVQMTDEFYPILEAHRNTVKLDSQTKHMIVGDAEKLARVFNNILKNAVAYSYQDTEIEIWTKETDNEITVYFKNTGKTIPAQKLDTVFEKFFRLDASRSTNTGGTGLGLAIARDIVELHGGKIWVESAEGVTVFAVSLPV